MSVADRRRSFAFQLQFPAVPSSLVIQGLCLWCHRHSDHCAPRTRHDNERRQRHASGERDEAHTDCVPGSTAAPLAVAVCIFFSESTICNSPNTPPGTTPNGSRTRPAQKQIMTIGSTALARTAQTAIRHPLLSPAPKVLRSAS